MTNLFDVSGKVFAITGAAGILCSEMASYFAGQGAKIALLDLNLERAQAVADKIAAEGGTAAAFACNVLKKDEIRAAFQAIIDRFGQVDVLVNGAGGNSPKASTNDQQTFFDLPEDALRFVFDLNFIGTLLPSQVFGEYFMKLKKGNIVNISSMSALRPLTRVAGYGAAKAAVSNFTQWLATYFAKNGCPEIRVNAICPGFLLTEQNRFLMTDKETGAPTERGRHVLQQTPMSRYGQPQELVGAVHFLCSQAAAFVTGVVLPIDGGFSIFSI